MDEGTLDITENEFDYTIERVVLSMLFSNGELLGVLSENGGLTEDDFASPRNRIIYRAILRLSTTTQCFDPIIVIEYLIKFSLLEDAGGKEYIYSIARVASSSSASIIELADILRDKTLKRSLIHTATEAIEMCRNPEGRETKEILDEISGKLFKLSESANIHNEGPQPAFARMVRLISEYSSRSDNELNEPKGVLTGFQELDDLTQGLQPGSLNIIAARPSVGKTSFAMNIVTNIAMNPNNHKPALVFSLEMPTDQLLLRMLSTFGQVSMNNLKEGKVSSSAWQNMILKIKLLSEGEGEDNRIDKLYIDDNGDITPLELRARARKIAMEHGGLSVIMVDYVQLMRPQTKATNRTLEIGEISRSLKMLAKELEVPILALAQLNREVDSRKDHRPLNSDLRESGSLEQDADMIMFLHREAVYEKNPNGRDNSHDALLIIGKNRNGATADINLFFKGEYTAFYDKGYAEANGLDQDGYEESYAN